MELTISHLEVGLLIRKVVFVGERDLRILDVWIILQAMGTP